LMLYRGMNSLCCHVVFLRKYICASRGFGCPQRQALEVGVRVGIAKANVTARKQHSITKHILTNNNSRQEVQKARKTSFFPSCKSLISSVKSFEVKKY
jgi:hypothetical protein